jgi:hypothetical protein
MLEGPVAITKELRAPGFNLIGKRSLAKLLSSHSYCIQNKK